MEEITKGLFRGISSIIRWLIVEPIQPIVLFNLGRAALLIATLGRYSRGELSEKPIEKTSCVGNRQYSV
jgi:hypothetical protein